MKTNEKSKMKKAKRKQIIQNLNKTKTEEEIDEEMAVILGKLQAYQLSRELSGIKVLQERYEEMKKTGNCFDGKIYFDEVPYIHLHVKLTNVKGIKSDVIIKNMKNIFKM